MIFTMIRIIILLLWGIILEIFFILIRDFSQA